MLLKKLFGRSSARANNTLTLAFVPRGESLEMSLANSRKEDSSISRRRGKFFSSLSLPTLTFLTAGVFLSLAQSAIAFGLNGFLLLFDVFFALSTRRRQRLSRGLIFALILEALTARVKRPNRSKKSCKYYQSTGLSVATACSTSLANRQVYSWS